MTYSVAKVAALAWWKRGVTELPPWLASGAVSHGARVSAVRQPVDGPEVIARILRMHQRTPLSLIVGAPPGGVIGGDDDGSVAVTVFDDYWAGGQWQRVVDQIALRAGDVRRGGRWRILTGLSSAFAHLLAGVPTFYPASLGGAGGGARPMDLTSLWMPDAVERGAMAPGHFTSRQQFTAFCEAWERPAEEAAEMVSADDFLGVRGAGGGVRESVGRSVPLGARILAAGLARWHNCTTAEALRAPQVYAAFIFLTADQRMWEPVIRSMEVRGSAPEMQQRWDAVTGTFRAGRLEANAGTFPIGPPPVASLGDWKFLAPHKLPPCAEPSVYAMVGLVPPERRSDGGGSGGGGGGGGGGSGGGGGGGGGNRAPQAPQQQGPQATPAPVVAPQAPRAPAAPQAPQSSQGPRSALPVSPFPIRQSEVRRRGVLVEVFEFEDAPGKVFTFAELQEVIRRRKAGERINLAAPALWEGGPASMGGPDGLFPDFRPTEAQCLIHGNAHAGAGCDRLRRMMSAPASAPR